MFLILFGTKNFNNKINLHFWNDFRGTPFHRIVTNYWCQGGDVTNFDGSGGTSIYGDTFEDENFELSHVDAGVLSMWSNGPNTNNSKFNLTFKRLESMDKRRVVFGRLINGLQHLHNVTSAPKFSKSLTKFCTIPLSYKRCSIFRSNISVPSMENRQKKL